MRNILIILLVFACALCGCMDQGMDDDRLVLKVAHSLDLTHPVQKGLEFMAEQLKEDSGGSIVMQIFPSSQLGSSRECIELIQIGCLDMTVSSTANMEGFIAEMGVFSLPYVFSDRDHYWKCLDGDVGREVRESGEKVGIRGLCFFDAGSRSFYTKDKPILSPDDLKGVKVRVMQSKTSMDMIKAMGGSPTPISWGELYTSLQQGVVDAAENNPPSYETSRHYEVCGHFSLDEHSSIPDMLLISVEVWSKLDETQRKIIQGAADAASRYQRKLWKERTEAALTAVKEKGVKIYFPDKGPFQEKVKPMYDECPVEVRDVLLKIKEVK